MNGIMGTKSSRRQCNRLLGVLFAMLKYKKIKIYRAIYIKVFPDGTVSCLTVSNGDVLNDNNNETEFPKLRIFYEEVFEIKVQDISILKYMVFRISQYPPGFSIDQTDHIMELVD